MRIRKRQVLFSSLQLSPEPLSDPHLISQSPVVVQLRDSTPAAPEHNSTPEEAPPQHDSASSLDRYQPSDQPVLPPIGKLTNGSDDPSGIHESGARKQHNKKHHPPEEHEIGASVEIGNHNRKGCIFGSETVLPPSSPSDGRWYHEGERTIPLKKRRGSFENDNNTKMKAKMKTKMNKNCSSTQNDNMEENGDEFEAKPHGKKRGIRGGALMEGSRCSRVNGRGWRCCQQTLVGYSLCEHHLGKGRLRSMTSVRSRSIIAASNTSPPKNKVVHNDEFSSSSPVNQTKSVVVVDDDDEKKPMIISTKKRMKLGMVKARSMSSLLGQTNATTTTQIAVANEDNNE